MVIVSVIMPNHTILLLQTSSSPDTRTWSDYESEDYCMEAVCKIYEEHLKRTHHGKSLSYDIHELFAFLDCLGDLSCLVLDPRTQVYLPRSRDWIKDMVVVCLKKQASR